MSQPLTAAPLAGEIVAQTARGSLRIGGVQFLPVGLAQHLQHGRQGGMFIADDAKAAGFDGMFLVAMVA